MLTGTIGLRTATSGDDVFLRAVFADSRSADFAGLTDPALTQLLDLQQRAQAADRAARHPGATTSVVLLDGEQVGTITVDRTARDAGAHLVDIAILSAQRGRGIGSRLIRELIGSAGRVTLSVWALNTGAVRLYERHGFQVDSERSGYLWMSKAANT